MGHSTLDIHHDEKQDEVWHEHEPPVDDYVPGSAAEKALLRKIDMRIVVRSSPPSLPLSLSSHCLS